MLTYFLLKLLEMNIGKPKDLVLSAMNHLPLTVDYIFGGGTSSCQLAFDWTV